MFTGVNVPLEVALFLCAAFGAAGGWFGRHRAIRRLDPRREPLAELLKPVNLGHSVDLAGLRNAARNRSDAVLHGQIDQLSALRDVWSPDTREQVSEHVAAVMRAGLRGGDRVMHADGESFTIAVPGADERAAARIAERLRHALAQLRLPQLGNNIRLTASFGVAAEHRGKPGDALVKRARRALDAALAQGQDHMITASEIEEIILLPAPEAYPSGSVA